MTAESVTFTKVHNGRIYGYSETGPKWQCDTCQRSGYGDPRRQSGFPHWSDGCKRGHSPCPWCGRQLTLRMDGTPRVHARCPDRPYDAELARLIGAEVASEVRLAIRGPVLSSAVLDHLMTSGERND